MKVYVASSWRNDLYPEVVQTLLNVEHDVYDFRHPGGDQSYGFHWSDIDPDWENWTPKRFRQSLQHPIAQRGLVVNMTALKWCEAVVLVMPCGRSAHLELGYAIGAGKRSVILLSDGEPELMYGMADSICISITEMLLALEKS